jgi:hypothetical protein
MLNLSKLMSALWGIMGLITLVTLFVTYANFPEYVNTGFPGTDLEIRFDRHRYFFVFAGLYLLVNLVIYIAIRIWSSLKSGQVMQHLRTLVGLKTLVIGANLFLITLMIFTRSVIGDQSMSAIWYWPLLWIGPLVMVSGLVFIIYTMLFPAHER